MIAYVFIAGDRLTYSPSKGCKVEATYIRLVPWGPPGRYRHLIAWRDRAGKVIRRMVGAASIRLAGDAPVSGRAPAICVLCKQECSSSHVMCDAGVAYCFSCFEHTDCGLGKHGEGCATYIYSDDGVERRT